MLVAQGHLDKEVFYRISSSGDCGPLNHAWVTDEVTSEGPHDLEPGEKYIVISAGH